MREAIKKYRILICLELILLILLLPGCFQSEKLVYTDGNLDLGVSKDSTIYTGDLFSVFPGVYQVRVNGAIQGAGTVFVKAESQYHAWRTFRCNGANWTALQDAPDFEVYVLEKLDNVYLSLQTIDCVAHIENVEVVRLNWGSRIVVFYLIVGSILLDILLLFRDGIISGKVSKEKQVVIWGMAVSVFVAYFPYMTDYFSVTTQEMTHHLLRIERLRETILHGIQFPIVPSNGGVELSSHGGTLSLWIPVLFRLIGFSLMSSYKMFIFVVNVMTAWIAFDSLNRCTHRKYAAMFGSAIYMLMPYRLYIVYNHGAVDAHFAMAFLPLIISGIYRLYTEDVDNSRYRRVKWSIVVGLTCVLQSHLPSFIMSVCLFAVVSVILIKKTLRKNTILQLFYTGIVFACVNAGFLHSILDKMGNNRYGLSVNLYSEMCYAGPISIGVAALSVTIVTLGVLFYKYVLHKKSFSLNPYNLVVLLCNVMIIVLWILSAINILMDNNALLLISVLCAFASAFFYLWWEAECKEWMCNVRSAANVLKGSIVFLLIVSFFTAIYHVNDISYQAPPTWLYNAESLQSIGSEEPFIECTRE